MLNLPVFHIKSTKKISAEFTSRNIFTFNDAFLFVKQLPYGRNTDKENLFTVFTNNRGTCSTKHALLKTLADENGIEGIRLMTGIFRMNCQNTPPVAGTLNKNNLDYIPEAHCYLRYGEQVLDATKINSKPDDFLADLLEEIAITPGQITTYKINYQKDYLERWLNHNKNIAFTTEEIWEIREQCIRDLSGN